MRAYSNENGHRFQSLPCQSFQWKQGHCSGPNPTSNCDWTAPPVVGFRPLCTVPSYVIGSAKFSGNTSEFEMQLASSISGISMYHLGPSQKSGMAWHYLSNAKKAVERSNLYIDENRNMSVDAMSELARRLVHEHGKLGLIVVEDVWHNLLSAKRGQLLTNELSVALKLLAQEHCCPAIGPTQLGRRMEMRRDKRPRLTDLRFGGRLEESADMIITIYRENYY